MTESEFINSIYCNFPYHENKEIINLINEANTISDNAIFMVAHEIARVPNGIKLSYRRKWNLMNLFGIHSRPKSKIKKIVHEASIAILNEQSQNLTKVLTDFEIIKQHKGQYNALNIIYFSHWINYNKLETAYSNIEQAWNS